VDIWPVSWFSRVTTTLLGGSLAGRILTCPAHGYQFYLATGRCATTPTCTYLVTGSW
jgi:nitrite reductase/ring-hydroxylating ferredoxin subunit